MESPNLYRRDGSHWTPKLVPSLILIGVGLLFLLNNLHIVYAREWLEYWPVLLIAVGLVKLVDSTYTEGRAAGGVLIGVGGILLAANLGFLNVRLWDLWPLFLIGAGLFMLWNRGPWITSEGREVNLPSPGSLNEYAIFGGGKRSFASQDFKGGQVAAMFGGFEIDLRKAIMTADSAVLEINAIFGGAEVKIPRDWSAVVQGVGIFGGFGDNTTQPEIPPGNGVKRLYVKGAAIFGGVDVKN